MILRRSSLGATVLSCHDLGLYFEPKAEEQMLTSLTGASVVTELTSKSKLTSKSTEHLEILLP